MGRNLEFLGGLNRFDGKLVALLRAALFVRNGRALHLLEERRDIDGEQLALLRPQ